MDSQMFLESLKLRDASLIPPHINHRHGGLRDQH